MKLNKDTNYLIVIFFSIIFIFLDAYELFSIPVSWIGMSLLLALSLIEYRNLFSKNTKDILLVAFTIVLIPQVFYIVFFESSSSDLIYIFLRIFNLVSFFSVLFFSLYFLQSNKLDLFLKYTKYLIYLFSIATIYIFIAQIFDLYEPLRNRSNTNIYGESMQSIFWLTEPHRAMGTFREPVFLVTFFFPVVLLYIQNINKKTFLIPVLSGIALGLTRSNYMKLFCIIFLVFLLIQYFLKKKIKFEFIIFFGLIIVFSTFGVFECNLNPESIQCLEYQEDVENMNSSGEIKIDSNINEPVVELGNDRLNVIKYFLTSIKFINPESFSNVNSDFQSYSSLKVNEEMYFSNRTLPKYLLQRYSTENFGTGNYSLIKYKINVQNLFVFYTQALGVIFPLFLFVFTFHFLFTKKMNLKSSFLLLIILFFFVSPIEEVNSYYGLIIGIAYNFLYKDRIKYEQI
tara:strand:- start:1522 stop:2892 length:1371 start_codon:yes stop_codon:yes gene_type:complete